MKQKVCSVQTAVCFIFSDQGCFLRSLQGAAAAAELVLEISFKSLSILQCLSDWKGTPCIQDFFPYLPPVLKQKHAIWRDVLTFLGVMNNILNVTVLS